MLYQIEWQRPPDKDAYDLHQDMLHEDDWTTLQLFYELLLPFHRITNSLQSNAQDPRGQGTHGAIWETLKAMDFLFQHIEQASDAITAEGRCDPHSTRYPQYYQTGVNCGFLKLKEYYLKTDETAVYRAAVMLHPSQKDQYFNQYWKKHPRWIKTATTAVQQLFEEYEEAARQMAEDLDDSVTPTPLLAPAIDRDGWGHFGRVDLAAQRRIKRRKQYSELEQFLDGGVQLGEEDIKDPIGWWRLYENKYPILSRMAYDLFSIPGMSAECERVFSHCGILITTERNRLSPQTVEATECQKNWLARGLLLS